MSLTKFNPRVGAETIKTVAAIDDVKSSKDFSNPILALGHITSGDGQGGGVYSWDQFSTLSADNFNIIKSNHKDTGRWVISTDSRVTDLIDTVIDIEDRVRSLEQNLPNITYDLVLVDAQPIEEGKTFNCRLTTTDIPYGTTLKYQVGPVGPEPVILEPPTGTFQMFSNEHEFVFTVANDLVTEANETITLKILDDAGEELDKNGSDPGAPIVELTINVVDDSTYSLVKTPSTPIARNSTFSVKLDVTEVADGTYPFTLATTNGVNITPPDGNYTVTAGEGSSIEFTVPDVTTPDGTTTTLSIDSLPVSQTYELFNGALGNERSFKVQIDTRLDANDAFVIGGASNITVNWGDDSSEQDSGTAAADIEHTYSIPGIYIVHILQKTGSTSCNFNFYYGGSASMLTEVLSWGTMSLSSLESFMRYCTNLETLPTIPSTFDTSGVTNMLTAWQGCSSLLSFPDGLDTSAVTIMHSAWFGCSSLTSFPSGLDTSNVTDVRNAWRNCSGLTSFPAGLDTSNVTSMSGAWYSCNSLTSFPSGLDTSNVTNIQQAWYNCYSLTSFPAGLDTSNVTNMSFAWYNCSSLTSFPAGLDTSNVTDIQQAWYSCNSLTSFPSGLDTSNVTNMSFAWGGCSSLTSFPAGLDTSNVTNIQQAWYNCSGLTSFPSGLDTSNVTNMVATWSGCSSLTSFPAGLDTSNVTLMASAWNRCSVLTSFPSIDISSVTNIENAWYSCGILADFTPFSNTTYTATSIKWRLCFLGTQITFSRADNPFLNLATGQDIPANTIFEFVQTGNYTNYLPRYDISNAQRVTPLATTSINYTAPEGSDIVGWNNITFTDVNGSGPPEIVMPTIPPADYDSIILLLYNNRANHTQLTGGNHYEADFNDSVSSPNVTSEKAALVSNGWIFTDGNP